MREFEGDLLIGGATLKHLHGELAQEQAEASSHDWQLSGQVHLSPAEWASIQCNRLYRLDLRDGRSGPVVVTRLVEQGDQEVVVEFRYVPRKPK